MEPAFVAILELLGTVGGLITCAALLHKASTTHRAKILWGNIKRVVFHRIQFSHGWGYHGKIKYRAINNQSMRSKRRPRFQKLLSKLEPDYVILTVPDEAQMSKPLVFTEMTILYSKMGAQLEFRCEFREAIIQKEGFLAIGFHVPGMDTLATTWSMSHEMREGWEISAPSSQIRVSLSESDRILRVLPDNGVLQVEVLGFRDGIGGTVGMFDLSKALNTPIKPWAKYFVACDSFNAHIRNDEPTDWNAIWNHLWRKSAAENDIGEPPPERQVVFGLSMGRRVVTQESGTGDEADEV